MLGHGIVLECRVGIAPTMGVFHRDARLLSQRHELVPLEGLAPPRPKPLSSELSVFAVSPQRQTMEKVTGLQPASALTLERRSSSLLSYGGKNGGSWMESNLVPGRDLVYSQTSGHRSSFAQPIDWYPMSGLNRLQQVCRTRHRPNGSGKYMLHARYLHRAPPGYTYPVVAVTSCRSPHEGLFWRLQRDSNSSLTGSTVRFHPRCRGMKWLPPLESNQTLTR